MLYSILSDTLQVRLHEAAVAVGARRCALNLALVTGLSA